MGRRSNDPVNQNDVQQKKGPRENDASKCHHLEATTDAHVAQAITTLWQLLRPKVPFNDVWNAHEVLELKVHEQLVPPFEKENPVFRAATVATLFLPHCVHTSSGCWPKPKPSRSTRYLGQQQLPKAFWQVTGVTPRLFLRLHVSGTADQRVGLTAREKRRRTGRRP